MANLLLSAGWTWLSVLAPCAQPAPAQGLALTDLVPQLLALDKRGDDGAWLVSDARVDELEAHLTAALRVPPPLEVSLLDSGSRIPQGYALGFGHCRAQLVHQGSGLELIPLQIAVDGEHLLLGTLGFADPLGASAAAKHALESGFPLSALPHFFRGLCATLPTFQVPGVELVHIEPERPLEAELASLRCAVRIGEAEAYVQVALSLASTPPESGVTNRPLGEVLATLVALVARLDFDFPHALRLRGLSHRSDDYLLLVSARNEAQQGASLEAAIVRERIDGEGAASRWVVMEHSRRLRAEAVDVAAFVALTNEAFAAAARSEEVLGAFGVAYDEAAQESLALVVTVPTKSLWDARAGHVLALRVALGGRARVVQRDELRTFESTRPSAFAATSLDGHQVRFQREVLPCTDDPAYPQEHLIQYRGLAAPNLVLVR